MRHNRASRSAFYGLLLGTLALGSGCTAVQGVREYVAYNDLTNDFVLTWRNGAWAGQSWQMHKHQFLDQPFLGSFAEGYRAGYVDVASGANGCTPALPPRKYWSWKYQTPEGQGKTAAWFAGYPFGAKAAEEECAGLYSDIQVSETLRGEYRLGHEPPFKSPLFFHNPETWCPPQHVVPEGGPIEGGPIADPAAGPVPAAAPSATSGMAPRTSVTMPVSFASPRANAGPFMGTGDLHDKSNELTRLPSVEPSGNPYLPGGTVLR
ncbi:MAG: hypothetical protein FJ297_11005 [Planctomycetes bacterium]|nr:hypothetical protein [Planctomycetota bacterium]